MLSQILSVYLRSQTVKTCPNIPRNPTDENGKVIFNYIVTTDCQLINLDKRSNW